MQLVSKTKRGKKMSEMTDEQRRIYEELRRVADREYARKRRDILCYKCKTILPEGTAICPKCGTRKRKYAPRSTRKNGSIQPKTIKKSAP